MQQIQYDVRPGEFADAMKSTRSARMAFWLLLGLAIIYQLVSFALVEFGGVLDTDGGALASKPANSPMATKPAGPVTAKKPTAKPAKKPGAKAKAKPTAKAAKGLAAATPASRPAEPKLTKAQKWHVALKWSLPAAKFLAMVAAGLLFLTIFFAVGLSLIGRLGGMAGLISAFFWALILSVMVVPWQQVLSDRTLACGALFNLGELLQGRSRWGVADATWQQTTLYYGRFVAYPSVALLIWLVVHVKFVRAGLRMHFPHAVAPAGVTHPATPAAAPKPQPTPPAKPAATGDRKISARGALTERFLDVRANKTEPEK